MVMIARILLKVLKTSIPTIIFILLISTCSTLSLNVTNSSKSYHNYFDSHEYLLLFEKSYPYYIPEEYKSHIEQLTEVHEVPTWLASRVIKEESGWRNIEGVTGDLGLMQLNPKYLDYFADMFNNGLPFDPFDPYTNIAIGIAYLSHLYRQLDNWEDAVKAYNCGAGKVINNKVPMRTIKYQKEIFQYSWVLKEEKPYVSRFKF